MSTMPAPTLGTRWTFSSNMLPEDDRFDRYLEEFSRKIIRIDAQRLGDTPFSVHLEMMLLGNVVCTVEQITPGRFGRTRPLLSDGNDDLVLFLNIGAPYLEPGGSTVKTGDVHLLDSSQAGQIMAPSGGQVLMFAMPRRVLLPIVPHAEDLVHVGLAQNAGIAHLLRQYAESVLKAPTVSQSLALLAGGHMLDLVALSLGARGEAGEVASRRGLRAGRYQAVCESVLAHLHDPELSLSQIAQMHMISERYLQRLFEEAGTSFTAFVIEERLMRAFRRLSTPIHDGVRIVDIAGECGFADLSNFNRAFRRRFGITPSEARKG